MIIGINGYIGAGKDLVGSIIKEHLEYPEPRKQFSGNSWEVKKFAAKLKQIASILTGIPIEKFEDQEFKKMLLSPEWNILIDCYDGNTGKTGKINIVFTVREFLQKLGTEAIRNNIHQNAWVNALFADYEIRKWNQRDLYPGSSFSPVTFDKEITHPNWIITDTRFPNEAQAIKDRGGIVIRVSRNFEPIGSKMQIGDMEGQFGLIDVSEKHPSETSLDNWEFDYTIENNGTIKELTEKVKKMLLHFNIISE